MCFAFGAALGCDENNASRGLRTIDSACGGILEDRDRFDVIGVYIGKAAFDAVYQHKG